MKTSSVLGIASAIVRGKKYRLLVTGIQFAYLGYKYVKNRKAKKAKASIHQSSSSSSL